MAVGFLGQGSLASALCISSKPMVLINNKPIIWHLMNIFSLQGFSEFIISTGYKRQVIETWVNQNEILDSNFKK